MQKQFDNESRQLKTTKTKGRLTDHWNSRTQFAERAGKHRQTLWRWERAGILPKPDGRDPFGNPLWRDSTIDNFLSGGAQAA